MMPANKTARKDWYQEITDSLVSEMQRALADNSRWEKSWSGLWKYGLPLRSTGETFTGINVWILALQAMEKGYVDPRWYTFNQAKEATGYKRNPAWSGKKDTYKGVPKFLWTGEGEGPRVGVRAGEKGTHVIRINSIPLFVDMTGNRVYPPKASASQAQKDAWKNALAAGYFFQKGCYNRINAYVVFNAEQLDGLSTAEVRAEVTPEETYTQAECMISMLGAEIRYLDGCDTAAYSPMADRITMPAKGQFHTEENFWATLMHEIVHWTGHKSRLDRGMSLSGSDDYAFEELVAEIGSAFLCAHLGIQGNLRHPEYLAAWIKRLQGDNRAVVKAATLAQKAVNFLINGGAETAEETPEDEEEVA